MVVSEITLFNTLKAKLGEQEAQTVVEGIKQEVKNEFENRKDTLATKEDIAKLEVKIAQSESSLTMKLFLFWVATIGALTATMFAMFNAYLHH